MDRQKWLLIIAMMLLIMSSMYVGAFISKHEKMRHDGVVIDVYRGNQYQTKRIIPKSKKVRVWPWVSIEYNL